MKYTIFCLFFFFIHCALAMTPEIETSTLEFSSDDNSEPAFISSQSPASSKMETLLDWYSMGSPMNFDEFKGYYSGRCFIKSRPNSPRNSMVGYLAFGDSGPGFDDLKVYTVRHPSKAPDFYDSLTQARVNIRDFKKVGIGSFDYISNVFQEPTLGYKQRYQSTGKFDEMFQYVFYNGYIVSKWTALRKRKYGNEGELNPGDTIGACYYFKKIGE